MIDTDRQQDMMDTKVVKDITKMITMISRTEMKGTTMTIVTMTIVLIPRS
ncbi:MAG: hypothetical protein IPJ39_03405 [Saprospiraceae bacterium]|nr:hypothetical protein [Saprospiraceae bacterium]